MTRNPFLRPDLKLEEYICYLYLCIASADLLILDKEVFTLKKGINKLVSLHFPQLNIDVDALVVHLISAMSSLSENEKRDILFQQSKKHPLPFDVKSQIVNDMHELIHTDENVAFSEYNMLSYIKTCLIEQ
jgi:hypothetical protein